ncbi:MAG TPA: zf-TFIIB domain-containing protein, partial [Steroidobacteraceae bacterium]|nr:zf-TFIIB domain-containing protein [Steroidobacteraceae bacterium]
EMLDTGSPDTGRDFDAVQDIDCPSCRTRMQHKTDAEQTHIGYESCPGCGGVFFDAGEFTDWKQETVSDFFKGLRARFRSR